MAIKPRFEAADGAGGTANTARREPAELASWGVATVDDAAPATQVAVPFDADPLAPAPLAAMVRVILLDQGLYALGIGPLTTAATPHASLTTPCIQLSSPPSDRFDPVDIMTAWNDQGAWLGPEGGTVVVRSPPGGGQILATWYGASPSGATVLESFEIGRLDKPRLIAPTPARYWPGQPPAPSTRPPSSREARPEAGASAAPAEAPPAEAAPAPRPVPGPGELNIEIAVHTEQAGQASYAGGVWCGNIGQKLQIEAYNVRPLERIGEADVEYKAFGPGGRETRWVSDAKLCGTRGRGIPLTGFAVRLVPDVAARFDVIYQGAFFTGGVTVPTRNGDPCLPPLADDTLEAINIRIVEKQT